MAQFKYVIKDEVGIHARPAGVLAKAVKAVVKGAGAGASVSITNPAGATADATKLMAMMGLGVKCGEEITVTVEPEALLADVQKLFEENV